MPDSRSHRGPHPEDARLFDDAAMMSLRESANDLTWLLNRKYPRESSVKLVGDKYRLTERQRSALGRVCCSDAEMRLRVLKARNPVEGERILLDGFNILTTLECALSGAVLLKARDSAIRDLASVRGTWRRVEETLPALRLIKDDRGLRGAGSLVFLLDRPVSNSARLSGIIRSVAKDESLPWETDLVADPDRVLCEAKELVITSDSLVLDRCAAWYNLAETILRGLGDSPWVLDFSFRKPAG